MCPLHLIPRIFVFEEEVAPELRAQRTLNRARVPEIARYLVENIDSYVFSAITASVDGELLFEPFGDVDAARDIGRLRIPMSARFLINDGQHRRAAIEIALRDSPDLGDESISIVFFEDRGLRRAQQMFTDLNQHAIRPSRSLGLLYEHRSERAWLAKEMVQRTKIFLGRIEMERSTLGQRSAKMFTLSAIETATTILLSNKKTLSLEERAVIGAQYWDAVAEQIPEWRQMRDKTLSGGEFRREYICAHGLALSALAYPGTALVTHYPETWRRPLRRLSGLDWSRSNTIWERRAMVGGRLHKSHSHVRLTTAMLKHHLGLPLTPEERRLEDEVMSVGATN